MKLTFTRKLQILAVLVVAGLSIWLLFQPTEVHVFVTQVNPKDVETIKGDFLAKTNNHLAMACKTAGYQNAECSGTYTAVNLLQLMFYQNNIAIAAKNSELNLSSTLQGSFAASLFH